MSNPKLMYLSGLILVVLAVGYGSFCLLRSRRARQDNRAALNERALAAVAAGIRRHAAEFDGLFEGLYQAAKIQNSLIVDAYIEWCDRVGQLADISFQSSFSSLFSKEDIQNETLCREKYQLLLRCFAQAGISRDRHQGLCCKADAVMQQAYIVAGGNQPQIGMEYTIIKPAWLIGRNVVEYGMVMPGFVDL